jgi:hypothetical protein
MAQIALGEYIAQLKADPNTVNTGTWYARSVVRHHTTKYLPGQQMPNEGKEALTNGQVAQLLEVNALTSVAPKQDTTEAPQVGAGDQTGSPAGGTDPNANGQGQPQGGQPAA